MKTLTTLRNKTFNVGEEEDIHLNACVGNNGHVGKRGYGAGFSEGAKLLLAELVKDGTEASVDTLIYPICFSARHSIELFLKEQIERMRRLRSTVHIPAASTTHDLSNLWEEFARMATVTDRRFAAFIPLLDSHIGDFAQIDPTGQTFRYPDDNESKRHLVATSIINVVVFKKRFEELANLIEEFENLSDAIREEYRCGPIPRNCRERTYLTSPERCLHGKIGIATRSQRRRMHSSKNMDCRAKISPKPSK